MLAGGVNGSDDLFLHLGFTSLQALSRRGGGRVRSMRKPTGSYPHTVPRWSHSSVSPMPNAQVTRSWV